MISHAPVSFAGGGSDAWEWPLRYGGSVFVGGVVRVAAALAAVLLAAAACGGVGGSAGGAGIPVATPGPVPSAGPGQGSDPVAPPRVLVEPVAPALPTEPGGSVGGTAPAPAPGASPDPPALGEPAGESTGSQPTGQSVGTGAESAERQPAGETGGGSEGNGASGDGAPPATAADGPEPGDGDGADASLVHYDCGQVYLCATLEVPLDHDDPGGGTVELAVGVLPARDPDRRIGYLLVNPGGPGGGLFGFLESGAGLSSRLLARFDVVGWDPRGVGGSVPADCQPEARDLHLLDPVPDSPAEQAELDAAARAVAEVCARNLGDAVGHIGTIHTVGDMDAIRRALGAEQISYLGYSYGTLLGLHYADMFGEHLRAAVLDGVVDPSLSGTELALGQMVGFARTIDDMFAWCRTEPDCALTGDPAETYDRVLSQLDAEPMRDAADRVTLDPARAILAVIFASYHSLLWPVFFEALAAAAAGDGGLLGRLGESYIHIADLGAAVSIGCTDTGALTRAELDALTGDLVEVAGDFGRASVLSGLPCEHWPVATGTLPRGAVAAPEAPPILVIGNRGDNATPYEWAVAVARRLASGVLVSYDGNEHTSYGLSACVSRVVDDYLIEGVVPAADVDCPAEG